MERVAKLVSHIKPEANAGLLAEKTAHRDPMEIARIFMYPIKSCAPVEFSEASFLKRGFKYDRRWMLVDETQHNFIHARLYPRMLLINISIDEENETLTVNAPDMDPLKIKMSSDGLDDIDVRLWDDKLVCKDHGDEVAMWFSRYVKARLRLVQMTYDNPRIIKDCATFPACLPDEDLAWVGDEDEAAMADLGPFLAIGEESVKHLNEGAGLDYEIPYRRFRPNLLLRGGGPHDEDDFAIIEIGGTRFKTLGGCPRCVFTTIDPDKGEFTDDFQPLASIRKYRRPGKGKDPLFGNLLIPESAPGTHSGKELGKLRVGDKINVLQWRNRNLLLWGKK